ncbi:MAG: acyloxyacyl hydrolase [Armatimonadetes bacterium]|nr:acyloxyacyl hydrolase [Armatimonadota bacterium]
MNVNALKPTLILALASSAFAAQAQHLMDVRDQSTYFGLFAGRSLKVLGTEEIRTGIGFLYGYGRPDRRLSFHGIPAQMVYEVYGDFTHSSGVDTNSSTFDFAVGALAIARYRTPVEKDHGFYFDIGFGAQYVSQTSHDLNLNMNTTPMLGSGYFYPMGKHEAMLGIRLLHISNGGRKKPNDGQNQLYVLGMIRF